MTEVAVAKTGASFARGKSKQDYATPLVFLDAVAARFGKMTFDLAAKLENRVCMQYYGPDQLDARWRDSLVCNWTKLRGNLWLNPPFDRIEPWAAKCAASVPYTRVIGLDSLPRRRIFFLVPASVGANWYEQHVHGKALVLFLNGRLSFDGKAPFPKDTLLACYGEKPGYECWNWRHECAQGVERQTARQEARST